MEETSEDAVFTASRNGTREDRLGKVLAAPTAPRGPVVGNLVRVGEDEVTVDYSGNPAGGPLPARTVVRLGSEDEGKEVVLGFQEGDLRRPLVLGVVQNGKGNTESKPTWSPLEVDADGKRAVLHAEEEIVLRSGKASITLTRAGKVIIRGAYVLSRSSGVNRIKGGSVQIN